MFPILLYHRLKISLKYKTNCKDYNCENFPPIVNIASLLGQINFVQDINISYNENDEKNNILKWRPFQPIPGQTLWSNFLAIMIKHTFFQYFYSLNLKSPWIGRQTTKIISVKKTL